VALLAVKLWGTHPELSIHNALGMAYIKAPRTDFGLLRDQQIPHDTARVTGALASLARADAIEDKFRDRGR
jgi:hypothetical protein